MIEIHGKSGCLKHVHSTLLESGITEFQSIKQLNQFIRTYNQIISELKANADKRVREDLETYRNDKIKAEEDKIVEIDKVEQQVTSVVKQLDSKIQKHRNRNHDPILRRLYCFLVREYSKYKLEKIKVDLKSKTKSIVSQYNSQIDSISQKILEYSTDPERIVATIMENELQRLKRTKDKIEELNPFIAGAIGENKVVKCLEKLSCEGILFNDYKLSFKPPIFNFRDKKKIHSIQLDHLLLTRAGLFILETKNWSKESIQDHDLRSPVEQINRSSFALFKFLNDSNKTVINQHHWGQKEIGIRNIVVMTNAKPNVRFKFVKIKSLDELAGYIEHFPNHLESIDMQTIGKFLLACQDGDVRINNAAKSIPKQTITINEMYRGK